APGLFTPKLTEAAVARAIADVNSTNWAKTAITSVVKYGIMQGEGNKFSPSRPITRAELAVTLMNTIQMPEDLPEAKPFTDAASIPAWAKAKIDRAASLGLITGYSSGSFKPNQIISRGELAVVCLRYLTLIGQPLELKVTDLTPKDEVPTWAAKSVKALIAAGILHGYTDGTFQYQKSSTRAETATLVTNMLPPK
ncbi:MAG TPA: S-layer homology domain-containing protein, partial [Bacillota bacterium]|nr:S-layer homology domain-containing protein [Bacillota bacterium]